MIEWVNGNLLEAKADALVNTVNTVGVMGKGIALQFKRAFPENDDAYRRACQAGKLSPGDVFIHQVGGIVLPRYILNVATKDHWRGRSKIEWIDKGLTRLVDEVRTLKIRSIAVPPLGCGYGGLAWSTVRPRIERAFRALPDVRVLAYEPKGAPPPERMPDRTKKPRMTEGRAAVLAPIHRGHVIAAVLIARFHAAIAANMVFVGQHAEQLAGIGFAGENIHRRGRLLRRRNAVRCDHDRVIRVIGHHRFQIAFFHPSDMAIQHLLGIVGIGHDRHGEKE